MDMCSVIVFQTAERVVMRTVEHLCDTRFAVCTGMCFRVITCSMWTVLAACRSLQLLILFTSHFRY